MKTSARTLLGFIGAGLVCGFGCGAHVGGQSGTDAFEVIGEGKPCEGEGLETKIGDIVQSGCLVCTCEENGTWACHEVCPAAPSPEPLGPQAPSPEPLGPQAPSPEPLGPQAPSPEPLGPQAPSPEPLGPQAPSPEPLEPQAPSPEPLEPLTPQTPSPESAPEANTPTLEPNPQATPQPDFPTPQSPGAMPASPTDVCYTSEGEAIAIGEQRVVDVCLSCTCVEQGTFHCEPNANCTTPSPDTSPTSVDPSLPSPQPMDPSAVCFGPDGGLVPLYSVAQLDACLECQCVAAGTFACSTSPDCDEE